MMSNDLKLYAAENAASEILKRFGVTTPEHIRVRDIAYSLGARVIEGRLKNAAASLVRFGSSATIRVRETDNEERKRFSIAHEVGHLVLAHGTDVQVLCSDDDLLTWYGAPEEAQANRFAAELLLPQFLVGRKCDISPVSFYPVMQIVNEFRTSITATAIRFVRFSPERCALIFSTDGTARWFFKSDTWRPYIRTKQKLASNSLAYDFFQGKELPSAPESVDADAWFDDDRIEDVVEHSMGFKRLNFVLSLLWIREGSDTRGFHKPMEFDRHLKIID